MTYDKLLTVSIAAYNADSYLKKCLNSIFSNSLSLKYCEVIIVNDGSTDNTLNIANLYKQKYPENVIVVNKENGGYGSTVNKSLDIASGKYFRLLDADDWFDSIALENFLKALSNSESDLILTPYRLCNVSNNTESVVNISSISPNKKGSFKDLNFSNLHITMHSMTFRTSVLKKTFVRLDTHILYTDAEFVSEPIPLIETYELINTVLYCYRVGRLGQSCDYRQVIRHTDDLFEVANTVASVIDKCNDESKRDFIYHQLYGLFGQLFNAILLAPQKNYSDLMDIQYNFVSKYPHVWKKILIRRPDIYFIYSTRGLFFNLFAFLKRKQLKF